MEKEFVTYEQALALKELGFNEPCFVYWVFNNVKITFSTANNKSGWSMLGFCNSQMDKKAGLCTAPTYSQAFRWFRKKYNLYSEIILDSYKEPNTLKVSITHLDDTNTFVDKEYYPYLNGIGAIDNKEYELAESKCLDKLIEIIKDLAVTE